MNYKKYLVRYKKMIQEEEKNIKIKIQRIKNRTGKTREISREPKKKKKRRARQIYPC